MRNSAPGGIVKTYTCWLLLCLAWVGCGDPIDAEDATDLAEASQALDTAACSIADVQWGPSNGVCSAEWRFAETQCTRPPSCAANAQECEPGFVRDDTSRADAKFESKHDITVNLSSCHMQDPIDFNCTVQRPGGPRPANPCREVCDVTDADRSRASALCIQNGEAAFRAQFAAQLGNGTAEYVSTAAGLGFGRRTSPRVHVFSCTATTAYRAVNVAYTCTKCQYREPCTTSMRFGHAGTTAARMRELAAPADSGRSIANEACTTCDDSPLSADGSNAAQKFECLASVSPPASRALNDQRMQLLYELFGSKLSEAQRARAQATYSTLAPQFAGCSPAESFSCASADARQQRDWPRR